MLYMISKIPEKFSKDRFVIETFYKDDETFRLWTFDSPGIRKETHRCQKPCSGFGIHRHSL